jgi:DnaJ-class molecular chaperone
MKKSCETCGGVGQISYFKGVSRFLLSSEECPECDGFGYIVSEDNGKEGDADRAKRTRSGRIKKKK